MEFLNKLNEAYRAFIILFIVEIVSGFLLGAVSPSQTPQNMDITGILVIGFVIFIVWIVLFIYGLALLHETIYVFQESIERNLEYERQSKITTLEHPKEIALKQQEMRYCPYCGAPLSKGARFCPNCGAKLR